MQNKGRVENSKKNIFWGILYRIILLICPFVLRTVMIYSMGVEYAGLGNLFNSVIQILSLTELGMSTALVFFMYKPIIDGDVNTVNALLNFYKKFFYIIGIIVLGISLLLLPMLPQLINGTYPSDINLYILFLIYVLNTCVGYFFWAYKRALLYASQRTDLESKVSGVLILAQYLVQICVLFLSKNYYLYIIVLPVFTVLINLIVGIKIDKLFPQYKAAGSIDPKLFVNIKSKLSGIVLQKIGTVVLTSVDNIVVSAFLGLTVLTVYNNYIFVISALHSILNITLISIIPSVGNSIVSESIEKNENDFKKFNLLYTMILSWCGTCLFVLYQPFMRLWMKNVNDENMFLSFYMIIILVLYFYALKIGDIVFAYNEADGLWDKRKYISIVSSLLNLFLNIASVKLIGLYGIVLSSIISIFLINIPADSYVLFKYYFKNLKEWKKYIMNQIGYIIRFVIVSALGYCICCFNLSNLIFDFIVKGLVCSIFSLFAYIIIYRNNKYFPDTVLFVKTKLLKLRFNS